MPVYALPSASGLPPDGIKRLRKLVSPSFGSIKTEKNSETSA